ncbi:MAG: bifunctional metallophosphatase/5'-nucleotidase [Phycisphaeraceae bacterium]|nr:bifunctional metallophosphatase/5'-nucleotidase [Phycisphaeraceae bacterium]
MHASGERPGDGLSRRMFLRGLMGAGLMMALPGGLSTRAAQGDDTITVSIMHTTDLHGRIVGDTVRGFGANVGGMARCATQIRRWRRENPNSLLLDLGDLLQGTDVGWRTDGRIMIDCINAMDYDAWALGNHEFDWGLEPVHDSLTNSKAPVIGTNLMLEGKHPTEFDQKDHPLSRIEAWKVFKVGGIRIGLMGFTTPGMPYWFPPRFREGMEFLDCAPEARRGEAALRAMGIDALVTFGHMGLRPDGDNQSNQVRAVMRACPTAAAYIGAHSHRLHLEDKVGDVIYTQANFWGSHLGRLDLTFDRQTRRLIRRNTHLAFMAPDTPLDPVIMDLCRDRLDESSRALAQPVGRLSRTLSVRTAPGEPSEVERLIAASIIEAMAQRQSKVDGVIHGLFERRQDFEAGVKTVADLWPIMPFENFLITAELTPAQITAILEEAYNNSPRNLMGMGAQVVRRGEQWSVQRILLPDGAPADPGKRYTIAFNTWDASGGGGRLMRMREIINDRASRSELHKVQSRQAMIEFFMRKETVGPEHLTWDRPWSGMDTVFARLGNLVSALA